MGRWILSQDECLVQLVKATQDVGNHEPSSVYVQASSVPWKPLFKQKLREEQNNEGIVPIKDGYVGQKKTTHVSFLTSAASEGPFILIHVCHLIVKYALVLCQGNFR